MALELTSSELLMVHEILREIQQAVSINSMAIEPDDLEKSQLLLKKIENYLTRE